MSYVPNNVYIFVAAYSGALAGMGASLRVPNDPISANSAGLSVVAGAYAQAVDTAWNNAAAIDLLQGQAILELSEAAWEARAPVTNLSNVAPANYTTLAAAIVALVQAASAYYVVQGIAIPPFASTGGAPGGPNTSLQFKNGGAFGGSALLEFDGTSLIASNALLAPGLDTAAGGPLTYGATSATSHVWQTAGTTRASLTSTTFTVTPDGITPSIIATSAILNLQTTMEFTVNQGGVSSLPATVGTIALPARASAWFRADNGINHRFFAESSAYHETFGDTDADLTINAYSTIINGLLYGGGNVYLAQIAGLDKLTANANGVLYTVPIKGDPAYNSAYGVHGDSPAVVPVADGDVTITAAQYSFDWIQINTGAWTAGHQAIFPTPASGAFSFYKYVYNNTGFNVTIANGGAVSRVLASGFCQRVRITSVGITFAGLPFAP